MVDLSHRLSHDCRGLLNVNLSQLVKCKIVLFIFVELQILKIFNIFISICRSISATAILCTKYISSTTFNDIDTIDRLITFTTLSHAECNHCNIGSKATTVSSANTFKWTLASPNVHVSWVCKSEEKENYFMNF